MPSVLPMVSVAMESVSGSGTSWNPPVGMDRTNETLDRLTMDFTAGPQPVTAPQAPAPQKAPAPQTSDRPSGFPARMRLSSPQDAGKTHDNPQPAPPVVASAPAAAPVEAAIEAPVASLPSPAEPPAEPPAQSPATSRVARAKPLEDIDQYLWNVYQRSATKRDSTGDFTWKDEAAAARLGLVTKQYVIGGMDPDFRTLLYGLGRAMDAAGLHWTILSGFRDDYRQGLASGYKAHVGNSFHGGSRATGGYGHGCAADIEASDGEGGSSNAVWKWVDLHGEKYGIVRPMKGIDPAHIQPTGDWHDVAFNMRDKNDTAENGYLTANVDGGRKLATLVDSPAGVSEAQFDCVRSHRGGFRLAGLSRHPRIGHAYWGGRRAVMMHPGRMHRFGRRRMVVDAGAPNGRPDAETARAAGQAGADAKVADTASTDRHTKAEASARNRRDARGAKVADGHRDKRPGNEASVTGGRPQRDAKAPGIKASGIKAPETRAAEVKASKAAESRHADDRHPQKRAAAETSVQRTKAKGQPSQSHVAERQDPAGKSSKKL